MLRRRAPQGKNKSKKSPLDALRVQRTLTDAVRPLYAEQNRITGHRADYSTPPRGLCPRPDSIGQAHDGVLFQRSRDCREINIRRTIGQLPSIEAQRKPASDCNQQSDAGFFLEICTWLERRPRIENSLPRLRRLSYCAFRCPPCASGFGAELSRRRPASDIGGSSTRRS